MSTTAAATRRLSIHDITAMKGATPIVCLTAYSAHIARILDAHIDLFIVGDSLGMVCYGMPSTLPVTLDMMIAHGKVVQDQSARALVVVDLPFGSYQRSPQQAFDSAARLLQESGAQAVKLEGGMEMVETVQFLTARAIPIMAHIGLKPQHVNSMGGYKYQGRDQHSQDAIMAEALAMQNAGAFALLLEGTQEALAAAITKAVHIPTIGIGASPSCDGQVLVTDDMIGLTPQTPRFVQQFAAVGEAIDRAAADYADAVRNRRFPTLDHCFGVKKS